jgi:AcrR family transcriptional regulator
MIDTRKKLIETAEILFSEQGYGPVSLRQIIAEAGVNLASVHYHFGSKEELLHAVIAQKAQRVNQERLDRLARLEPGPGGRLVLSEVLEAFLQPMADAAERYPRFVQLMGRIHAEGLLHQVAAKHFRPIFEPFFKALRNAVPHLSEIELQWRIHFLMGAVAHTMSQTPAMLGLESAGNYRLRVARLHPFLTGALAAPAAAIADAAPDSASVNGASADPTVNLEDK